jgi:FixJ family two-component response regulator
MPGMSGVEFQSLLVAQGRRTAMIVITAFNDEAMQCMIPSR